MKTPQSFAAVARQVLALLGVIFGVLTQSVTAMHLPVVVSGTLTFVGGLLLVVEHYVSDPSTGKADIAADMAKLAPQLGHMVGAAMTQVDAAASAPPPAPVLPHGGTTS